MIIEFYGIPRERAGVASTTLPGEAAPRTLDELWRCLDERFPRLAASGSERSHYAVNLNGERFVHDPATPIPANASVLIMSADAGG